MIRGYRWGDMTPDGVNIDHMAKTHVGALLDLIGRLDAHGWKLAQTCEEGIVVEEKEWDRIKDRVTFLSDRMHEHAGKFTDYEFIISDLRRLIDMKQNIDYSVPVPKEIDEDVGKDITGEFFVLFDFLPDHIKKELRIYIKNKKP